MEVNGTWPWNPPADMERRRVADLENYKRNNPTYMEVTSEVLQLHGGGGPPKVVGKRPRSKKTENRWSLQTTLELLEGMKAFVRRKKLPHVGSRDENWKAIVSNMSNPYGLELSKYARSSEIRYRNVRRILKGGKGGRVEPEVKESMMEYDRICARFRSSKSLSTPSTPGTEEEVLELSSDSEEESGEDSLRDPRDLAITRQCLVTDDDDDNFSWKMTSKSETLRLTSDAFQGESIVNRRGAGSIRGAIR